MDGAPRILSLPGGWERVVTDKRIPNPDLPIFGRLHIVNP